MPGRFGKVRMSGSPDTHGQLWTFTWERPYAIATAPFAFHLDQSGHPSAKNGPVHTLPRHSNNWNGECRTRVDHNPKTDSLAIYKHALPEKDSSSLR